MYNKNLEAYLRAKTTEISARMQKSIDAIVPVYNTNPNVEVDEAIVNEFNHIVFAIYDWMRLVLNMELLEYDKDYVRATLILPYYTTEYSVEYNVSGEKVGDDVDNQFSTPIGKIDYFVYRAICDIPNNPVQVFYKWVKQQCELAHILISLSPEGYVPQEVRDRFNAGETVINWDGSDAEGFPDDILNDAILELAGVHDPLNLCSLDSCVSHIDEFFDSYGFHEGRGIS